MRAIISILVLIVFIVLWSCFLINVISPEGLVKDKTWGWIFTVLGVLSLGWYFQFCIDEMWKLNKMTQEEREKRRKNETSRI